MAATDVLELQSDLEYGGAEFDANNGLRRLNVRTPEAQARPYLQGDQLVDWQPACQGKVLFLSRTSEFAPGKAIRGGSIVSSVFWDAKPDRIGGRTGTSHGFAPLGAGSCGSAECTRAEGSKA